ncbi:two-component sensor histidine kinase [Nocardioides gansuensis]|uniref:histidine kinase n=2 Tax=Nocardioides gansuensis TaxID=2138300 RepID=A0A2T8FEF0_9ACTN|nr:two-component sensor histidine kinase [Nocardioides gansuensis]
MAVLCVGIALIYATLDRQLAAVMDADLRARAADLVAAVRAGDVEVVESDPTAQLYAADGRLLAGSDVLGDLRLLPVEEVRRVADPTLETVALGPDGPAGLSTVRILSTPVDATRTLSVAVSARPLQEAQDRLLLVLLLVGPVLVGMVALIGWWAVWAALRPVDLLTREAAAISSLHEPRHLPAVPGNDEIARLSRTLDDMLTRLRVSLERERGFVDDASHELRSPIAVLRGELELALSALDDPAETERSLRAALTETERLTRLAEDLLLLARERAGSLVVRNEPVDLVELAATEARRLGPGLRLSVAVTGEPAVVEGDPDRLRQVIANALHNSSQAGADTVQIEVSRDHGWVSVVIADDGPGFPASILSAAFERFVRGDQARTPGRSGAGLGLSIVRAIVSAHEGAVEARNGPPLGGAVLTVRLPHPRLGEA